MLSFKLVVVLSVASSTQMSFCLKPRFRYVVYFVAFISLFVQGLLATILGMGLHFDPKGFSHMAPLKDIFFGEATGLFLGMSLMGVVVYLIDRRKSLVFSETGIEVVRGGKIVRQITWEDVRKVRVAPIGVGVYLKTKPFRVGVAFIDSRNLLLHFPPEQRHLVHW